MPYFERSRSRPSRDCLTPPNDATSVEMMPVFDANNPIFERFGDAEHARNVAPVATITAIFTYHFVVARH